MSAITAIPVSITPDAASQVGKLGIQPQLEQMIEHTRNNVAGLRCIEVFLEPRYGKPGEEPAVTVLATRDDPHLEDDPIGRQLARWEATTFPPDVCRHIGISIHYETADAG